MDELGSTELRRGSRSSKGRTSAQWAQPSYSHLRLKKVLRCGVWMAVAIRVRGLPNQAFKVHIKIWNKKLNKWNEIKRNETKRNETKRNGTERNEMKRNETKRNETKRNETKQNETKRNETKRNETTLNKIYIKVKNKMKWRYLDV